MADKDAAVAVMKEKKEVGRPCKYESHVEPRLKEIYQWVKEGMTDYSIAETLGIHKATLVEYKDRYSELAELYTRAIRERNALVMNKMYQKASGIKEPILKQKITKDGDVVDLVEEVYIPPDVNAADLFLRNNDPEYKSQKHIESGNITINNIQIPQLQDEIKRIEEQRKALEMQLSQGVWQLEE